MDVEESVGVKLTKLEPALLRFNVINTQECEVHLNFLRLDHDLTFHVHGGVSCLLIVLSEVDLSLNRPLFDSKILSVGVDFLWGCTTFITFLFGFLLVVLALVKDGSIGGSLEHPSVFLITLLNVEHDLFRNHGTRITKQF